MGLYEVPLSISLFGFGMGRDYSQLPYVWYYVGVKSSFQHAREECESKRANSRFLGLVSVWAARSFDQTALRPSVIKRIRQIDVKYITHITSFGVTA